MKVLNLTANLLNGTLPASWRLLGSVGPYNPLDFCWMIAPLILVVPEA